MESAGEKLKKIRLSKGIKLEDVQKKTRIHMSILQALEGDGITDLNPVYLKGFLRIYCQFLGVDPKGYIPGYQAPQGIVSGTRLGEEIQERPPAAESPKPVEKPYWSLEKEIQPTTTAPVTPFKLKSVEPLRNKRIIPIIGVVVLTGFLSLGLFNLGKWLLFRTGSAQAKVKARRPSAMPILIKREDLRQGVPPLVKSGISTQATALSSKETVSGIRLVIRAKDNCWISLKADGRIVFQRVLEKGRFGGWRAKEKIELSLGNAGAVELEVNGRLFTNLGRKGQARKNIIITRDGLKIAG